MPESRSSRNGGNDLMQNSSSGWRDGSMAKSVCCTSIKPELKCLKV